ncbi:MAG TPA: DMT family transporter [Solirubrobacteraceae bacterium]|jgi:transporter family-2 protein
MSRGIAVICTLAVGGLVALQPPANAALSKQVGDLGAAFVSLAISISVIGLLLLVIGQPGHLKGLSHFRLEYLIGGLAGAAVVSISLITVRPLGVGGIVALLVAGQLVVSVLADRFKLFGTHYAPISFGRVAGLLLVIAGTVLVTKT